MRITLAGFALVALAQAQAAAPPKPGLVPRTVDARQLTITLSQSHTLAAEGSKLSLFLDVVPKPKMHVYAPDQKEGYIRVELTLDSNPMFKPEKTLFPPASDYYFAPLKETFRVYNQPFRITQVVTLWRRPGKVERARNRIPLKITGTLRYQACDDEVCYRPESVPVSWNAMTR